MPLPRVIIALAVSMLVLIACTDEGPTQAEFNEAMEGLLSDPSSYELEIISCDNDGEFVRYSWSLRNVSDGPRTFAFDPIFVNLRGGEERAPRELVGDTLSPGEKRLWEGVVGLGEEFPIGDVECRFEVVDSVLGEFRNEE